MKKEYKAPIICIHTIQTEYLLLDTSGTGTTDNTGGGGSSTTVDTSKDQEGPAKPNSGLMDWDDEEW
ncbi:MAG TPA: hypothetical protein DEQ27_08020 [Prevotella sp.]|nr:hypothetical protein [Prevotella sp.]